MQIQFGAQLRLSDSYRTDTPRTRQNVEEIAEGTTIRHVLNTTDPDIIVTIRPRDSEEGGSEALVRIDKPEAQLPETLKKYAEPQSFFKFYASKLAEVGEFSRSYYRMDNVRMQITDMVLKLHGQLHPKQPLGLLPLKKD